MRRFVLLPMVLALAACSPTGPDDTPRNAVEFAAHPIYSEWWSEVEADAGIQRSMDRVRFFRVTTVSGSWYNRRTRRSVRGLWSPSGEIYLADHGGEFDLGLVKHEFLHELLRGDKAHKNPLFAVYDALQYCYLGACEPD